MATFDIKLLNADAQVVFADHAGDFSPTAANDLRVGTPTNVQLSLAGVVDGAARQSAKVALPSPWAESFLVSAAFEFAPTPVAREVVELWWAGSPDATAGVANPAGVSGTDSAYTGYSSNLGNSVVQLERIGTFVCTANATPTIQVQTFCGIFVPRFPYGSLVVKDESGAAYHSDDVECHVVFTPLNRRAIELP